MDAYCNDVSYTDVVDIRPGCSGLNENTQRYSNDANGFKMKTKMKI